MRFIFLGTGAGVPSRLRNVSSMAVVMSEYGGDTWLFDVGEGTQHRILESPVRLPKVSRIFITHLHGDHLFGLPGLLGSRSFQNDKDPLTLYGPKGLRRFVETALEISGTTVRFPFEIVELEPGMTVETPHFHVRVGLLDHRMPSFGFRLEEKDRPGELNTAKLKEAGIPSGPVYGRLKAGETVRLEDGRIIRGSDFLGPVKKGRVFTILGDTRLTKSCFELAKDAKLLVHEATYRAGQEHLAKTWFHSTTTQAAQVALESHVHTLVLTHISPRFSDEDGEQLLQEAREVFPRTFLAHDGWILDL
ncbi:ribonuclease Z [Staphylospora marina]|uniref:ribonuclease Z n=1 Tax=Staphylospora marina TaxID=2490858 RepID=UPI000F5B9699|nr:ribonuclease Z [Staphylospora marina]